MEIAEPQGATPIEADELSSLIPHLTTRGELNQFEQLNINQASNWARGSRTLKRNLLKVDSLKLLHRRMFDETWRWAGQFRTRATNLGVEPHQIGNQVAGLCEDVKHWELSLNHLAVRFHHRLVSIHPFRNGNGRHARLVADLLMIYGDQTPFKWGGESLDAEGETREQYLAALRKADAGNYDELIKFAVAE